VLNVSRPPEASGDTVRIGNLDGRLVILTGAGSSPRLVRD